MTAPLELTIRVIDAEPAPQGSFFARIVGGGERGPLRAIVVPDHKATAPWRKAVVAAAKSAMHAAAWLPLNEPLAVEIVFVLPKPKTVKRALPCTRPDLDKLARSTLDAMTDALVYADDGRICRLTLAKRYAGPGQPTGARIRVTAMSSQLVIM